MSRFESSFDIYGEEGLRLGRETHVALGAPVVRKTPRAPGQAGDMDLEVTIPAMLTFRVCVARGLQRAHCAVCDAVPPLPDVDALLYLLRNHDGSRLVFPAHESVEEKRDLYPVTGWHRRNESDGEGELVCDDCHRELKAAETALKKRKKGGGA